MTEPDPMNLLARYAPSAAVLEREWAAARPADIVDRILADDLDGEPARLVARPPLDHRRRLGTRVPVLASLGALGAAAAVLIAVLIAAMTRGDGQRDNVPAGRRSQPSQQPSRQPMHPSAALSTKALAAGRYSYRVVEQYSIDKHGNRVAHDQDEMVDRSYVSAKGDIVSFRSGSQHGCFTFSNQGPDFSEPDVTFFRVMPTDVGDLMTYLRKHVEGSSSRDEAVFVAVADSLRTADALASPKLRAAFVAVLSRTAGVSVHLSQRDDAGRAATRLDFVDQRIRPGEVHSLYFDPTTFQLLEERGGSNGEPTHYSGPSPAYNAPAPSNTDVASTPDGPAFIQIMRTETTVDHLPALPKNCQH